MTKFSSHRFFFHRLNAFAVFVCRTQLWLLFFHWENQLLDAFFPSLSLSLAINWHRQGQRHLYRLPNCQWILSFLLVCWTKPTKKKFFLPVHSSFVWWIHVHCALYFEIIATISLFFCSVHFLFSLIHIQQISLRSLFEFHCRWNDFSSVAFQPCLLNARTRRYRFTWTVYVNENETE